MNFDRLELHRLRARNGKKWSDYSNSDVLPAWVADMDFPVAEPIRQTLSRALELDDFGYCSKPPEDPVGEIFAARMRERFAWCVDPARVEALVDVVQGIYIALEVYSEPGDGVIVLTPSYPPFLHAVQETGRRLISHTLDFSEQHYSIDFERLQASIDPGTRILLLCSPHNPTGRVWRRAELQGLAELALERDLIIIADEIHADLTYPGHPHIVTATLGPEVAARTVTFTSATKAFSIAGLRFAIGVFGSDALRQRFNSIPRHIRGGVNSLGIETTKAAWRDGQPWLDRTVAYLHANRDLLSDFLDARLPAIRYAPPEATYLAWLDCRALALPQGQSPHDFFLEKARVAFSDGAAFGAGGEGCVRLNFATSRAILQQMLERVAAAL